MLRTWLALTLACFGLCLLAVSGWVLLGQFIPQRIVAYVTLREGDPLVMVHDLNHGLKRPIPYHDFINPTISPDGRYIAVTELVRFSSDIFVIDLTDRSIRNITQSPARDETPVWSPDGEWIAFSSNRNGDNNLYVVRPDGSDLRVVAEHPASDRQPTWSPDSQSLAFSSNRNVNWDIYTVEIASDVVVRVTNDDAPANQPAWSPDGQQLVFVSQHDLYLYDFATDNVAPLIATPTHDLAPQWTPDGQSITFSRVINSLPATIMRYDMATGDITTMDLDERYVDTLVWSR